MRDARVSFERALRRHGFRKWYERELLSGHAHMLLSLLSVIGLMAAIEAFAGADRTGRLANVGIILLCAAIGGWALRRYLYLLMHAEQVANQANCGQCGSYGLLDPVTDAAHPPADGTAVRCRRCGHTWTIDH